MTTLSRLKPGAHVAFDGAVRELHKIAYLPESIGFTAYFKATEDLPARTASEDYLNAVGARAVAA